MTNQVQLHVGYVGITREGKRVEITDETRMPDYPFMSSEYNSYCIGGNYWCDEAASGQDIVAPWVDTPVEPLVDYNDGKWHRWAGGDRPVHPSSVVHATFLVGIGEPRTESRAAHMFVWGDCASPIVAFRVTKEYVEPPKVPREFWVEMNNNTSVCATHMVNTKVYRGTTLVHVKEVLTDD
jgi:hypothetical protein